MSPLACLNAFCPIAICYCFPALLLCYFAKLLNCCSAKLLLCFFAALPLCMFNFAFLASSAESGFALSPPSSCTESAISATGQIQRRRRRRRSYLSWLTCLELQLSQLRLVCLPLRGHGALHLLSSPGAPCLNFHTFKNKSGLTEQFNNIFSMTFAKDFSYLDTLCDGSPDLLWAITLIVPLVLSKPAGSKSNCQKVAFKILCIFGEIFSRQSKNKKVNSLFLTFQKWT